MRGLGAVERTNVENGLIQLLNDAAVTNQFNINSPAFQTILISVANQIVTGIQTDVVAGYGLISTAIGDANVMSVNSNQVVTLAYLNAQNYATAGPTNGVTATQVTNIISGLGGSLFFALSDSNVITSVMTTNAGVTLITNNTLFLATPATVGVTSFVATNGSIPTVGGNVGYIPINFIGTTNGTGYGTTLLAANAVVTTNLSVLGITTLNNSNLSVTVLTNAAFLLPSGSSGNLVASFSGGSPSESAPETGAMGYQFVTAQNFVTVSGLGRWNTADQVVIYNSSCQPSGTNTITTTGTRTISIESNFVALASVTITPPATGNNTWTYGTLSSPVLLYPHSTYQLVCTESISLSGCSIPGSTNNWLSDALLSLNPLVTSAATLNGIYGGEVFGSGVFPNGNMEVLDMEVTNIQPGALNLINSGTLPLNIVATNGLYLNGMTIQQYMSEVSAPTMLAGLTELWVTNGGTNPLCMGLYTSSSQTSFSLTNANGWAIGPAIVGSTLFSNNWTFDLSFPASASGAFTYLFQSENPITGQPQGILAGQYYSFYPGNTNTPFVSFVAGQQPFNPTNYLAAGPGGNQDGSGLTNVNAAGLPTVITIYTNNYFSIMGATYGPFADQTLTVSNAWNMIPVQNDPFQPLGNYETYFMPGAIHKLGRFPLYWPPRSIQNMQVPNDFKISGAGYGASVLLDTNNCDMFRVGTVCDSNSTSIAISGLGMGGTTNAAWTNGVGVCLLRLGCFDTGGVGGGINSGYIHDCWFFRYDEVLRHFNLIPDMNALGNVEAIVPICLNNADNNDIEISHNSFDFTAPCYLSGDHLTVTHNFFEGCGQQYSANFYGGYPFGLSAFPTNSPMCLGYPVVFGPAVNGSIGYDPMTNYICSGYGDGNAHFHIGDNEFIQAGGTAGYGYAFIDNPKGNYDIYDDGCEGAGANGTFIATMGAHVTVHTIMQDSSLPFSQETAPFVDITNANGFFGSKINFALIYPSDTGLSNLVQYVDSNNGFGQVRFDATNNNNIFNGTFSGNGTGITNPYVSHLFPLQSAFIVSGSATVGTFIPNMSFSGGLSMMCPLGAFWYYDVPNVQAFAASPFTNLVFTLPLYSTNNSAINISPVLNGLTNGVGGGVAGFYQVAGSMPGFLNSNNLTFASVTFQIPNGIKTNLINLSVDFTQHSPTNVWVLAGPSIMNRP